MTDPSTRAPALASASRRDRLAALGAASLDDDDGHVGDRGQDRSVGDARDGRAIEHDHVELLAKLLEDLAESIGAQELCRVRGQWTAGDDLQPFLVGFLTDRGRADVGCQQE